MEKVVRDHLLLASKNMKRYYDRTKKETNIRPGDYVFRRLHAHERRKKLDAVYTGPYLVTRVDGNDVTYADDTVDSVVLMTVHASLCKLSTPRFLNDLEDMPDTETSDVDRALGDKDATVAEPTEEDDNAAVDITGSSQPSPIVTDNSAGSEDPSSPGSPESLLQYHDADDHDAVLKPKEAVKERSAPLKADIKIKRLQLYRTAVEYIQQKVPYCGHLEKLIAYEESAEYNDRANPVASALIQKVLLSSSNG